MLSTACPDFSVLTLLWEKQAQPRWLAALKRKAEGLLEKALTGSGPASNQRAREARECIAADGRAANSCTAIAGAGIFGGFLKAQAATFISEEPQSQIKRATFVLALEIRAAQALTAQKAIGKTL